MPENTDKLASTVNGAQYMCTVSALVFLQFTRCMLQVGDCHGSKQLCMIKVMLKGNA